MVANVGRLVEKAREEQVPVVWVQHSDENLARGSDEWTIVPELNPDDAEPLIEKNYFDAFEDASRETLLSGLGVRRLIVVGALTDACIRSTLHGAFVRGIRRHAGLEVLLRFVPRADPRGAVSIASLFGRGRAPNGPGRRILACVRTGTMMRRLASAALIGSALAFMLGLITLYQAEGPGAPDLWVYLAGSSGQADVLVSTAALTTAVVLFLVGFIVVCATAPRAQQLSIVLAGSLATAAVPAFIGFLALQFSLVATLHEGIDPNSVTFRSLVLQAHAAADWAGWAGIVLLSVPLILVGSALTREGGRSVVGWGGIVGGVVGLLLIPAGLGFGFTLILALWELVAAIDLIRMRVSSGDLGKDRVVP